MDIRRIVAASTLGVSVGVVSLIGPGSASAAPGISYDGGNGNAIGFGDAHASATPGNRALAISLGKPASASAITGTGNSAIAIGITKSANARAGLDQWNTASNSSAFTIDGTAETWAGTGNRATSIGGRAFAGQGKNNRATAYGGEALAGYGDNNRATSINGKAYARGAGTNAGETRNNNVVLALGSYIDTEGANGQVVAAACGVPVIRPTDSSVKIETFPGPNTGVSCLP